jgi:hypothetical protein
VTVTVLVDVCWTRPDPLKLSSRTAIVARRLRFRTPAKLYVYDTILKRLGQDVKDLVAARGRFLQEEYAMVGQRHGTRHWHGAPINPRAGMGKWAADKASIDPARVGRGQPPCKDGITSAGAARWPAPYVVVTSLFLARIGTCGTERIIVSCGSYPPSQGELAMRLGG